jgi:hypothetical protein
LDDTKLSGTLPVEQANMTKPENQVMGWEIVGDQARDTEWEYDPGVRRTSLRSHINSMAFNELL